MEKRKKVKDEPYKVQISRKANLTKYKPHLIEDVNGELMRWWVDEKVWCLEGEVRGYS